jgi:hypothetical protein
MAATAASAAVCLLGLQTCAPWIADRRQCGWMGPASCTFSINTTWRRTCGRISMACLRPPGMCFASPCLFGTSMLSLLLLVRWLQDLLESPHLTLELMSIMDTLPKNLDTVSMHVYRSKGTSWRREICREYKLRHRKACGTEAASLWTQRSYCLHLRSTSGQQQQYHGQLLFACSAGVYFSHCTLATLTSSNILSRVATVLMIMTMHDHAACRLALRCAATWLCGPQRAAARTCRCSWGAWCLQ